MFLFLALFLLFQKLFIDIPFKIKIKSSATVQDALKIRRSFRYRRIIYPIVFVAVQIFVFIGLPLILDKELDYSKDLIRTIITIIIEIGICFIQLKAHNRLLGNISMYSIDSFLERESRFVLYLRSFEKDNYSKKESVVKSFDRDRFSEYWFAEALRLSIKTCAVGMTKETDSPLGAIRIYLDDKNWKKGVSELLEKAEKVYILVDDRTSCVWEIEQTTNPLIINKTTYIIDNLEKYDNVKKTISTISFPAIPVEFHKAHSLFYIQYENEDFRIIPLENTIKGYGNMLKTDTRLLETKIRMLRIRKNFWKAIKIQSLFIFLSFVFFSWFDIDSPESIVWGTIVSYFMLMGVTIPLMVLYIKQFFYTAKHNQL